MKDPKKAPMENPDFEDQDEKMELAKSQEIDDEDEEETYLDLPGDEMAGDGFPDDFYQE